MIEMTFFANEDQIYQIFTNAINASKPVGFGRFQYKDVTYTVDEVKTALQGNTSNHMEGTWLWVDYFEGRMVKLTVSRENENEWFIAGDPKIDYQSWVHKYPSYEALIKSVI
jgi:hypothetical protein